jgi:pimeloyl-ACP methyl ester carboxylesterase
MTVVNLSFEEVGDGANVVILHGLFGMGRNWAGIAASLADHHRVLSVDLRNHGDSPWVEAMDYPLMAADVARLIETECDGQAAVIGHSMGGKTAMALACEHPERVSRLVVVDIAPTPYDHDFMAPITAMQQLDMFDLTRRSQAQTRLATAMGDMAMGDFLSRNLMRTDGAPGFQWQINIAAITSNLGTLQDFPAYTDDQAFPAPTLFISGVDSDYVQPQHQGEIDRLFPQAEMCVIADAGHWVHAEQPEQVSAVLKRFLPPHE